MGLVRCRRDVVRRYVACLLVMLGGFVIAPIKAQAVDETTNRQNAIRIGYVNIRKIMAQAPQIRHIQKKLLETFESERQAIFMLRNEIAKLSNSYDEQATANKPDDNQEALQALQEAIDEKQLALAKMQQNLQNAYNLRRNESLAALQTLIVNTVAKVSKEKRLDIVLNNTGVIYVNSRIDISPDVLAYLSEQPLD